MDPLQLALGALLGGGAALIAYKVGALTARGAVTAALVGALTFGIGGLVPAVLLLTFFISSSLLTRGSAPKKRGRSIKRGRRDEWQVLANGAVPTALAVAYGLTANPSWLVGMAGALAATNSDTWATEVGIPAGQRPRMITTWSRVDPGTSGAVSLPGTAAALAGALLIGVVAAILAKDIRLIYAASLAGLLASLVDSLLGATLQASYWCPQCETTTEDHPVHACGTETIQIRGLGWMGNDQVNLFASFAGAGLAYLLWIALT